MVIESYAHDARANQDDIQSTENPSLPVTAPEIFPINIGETEPAPIPPEQDTALSGGDEIAPTALEDQAAGGGTTAPLISDPQPPAAPPTDAAVRHVADWIAETTTDRDGPLAELIAAVADDADAADDSAACEHLARRLLRATTFPPPPLPDAPAACDVPAAFLERCGAIGAAVLSQRSPVGTLRTLQREVGIDRTGFDWTGDGQIRSDVPPEHRDRLRPEIRRTVDAFCTMAAEVRHGDVT